MAYTHTQPVQEGDFLEGFNDQEPVLSQVYLFQTKTGSNSLDNALHATAREGAPAVNIAYVLELSTWSDVVEPKALELAARFRKEFLHET